MNKPKTIFEHITNICEIQNPKYMDNLSEQDLETFNIYLIQKFLALNNNLLYAINIFEKYAHKMEKKDYYKLLIYNIPKRKYFLNFNKKDKKEDIPDWFIKILIEYFIFINVDEARSYFQFLTKEERILLAKKFGIDDKKIKEIYKMT